MNQISDDVLLQLFSEGLSDSELSARLKASYPGMTGFSVRSVQNWRLERGLTRRVPQSRQTVEDHVRKAVGAIGVHSGRRYVKAYIHSSEGVSIGEARVGRALRTCFPDHHTARHARAQAHFNPTPYLADYFGHKLHCDQNEKLVNFGVTHVAAIDGYSGFVVAHATMPIKNNVTIYEKIYRKSLLEYGLWDQVVVDRGNEFQLVKSYQEYLRGYRNNTSRAPYLEIQSTKNNRIERVWVEVNQRINYPIKAALESLVDTGDIDRNSPHHRFAVFYAACEVAATGIDRLFRVRNARYCRKRGIPEQLMNANNKAVQVDPALVMAPDVAADSYRQNGGTLTDETVFGIDPAAGDLQLQAQREHHIRSFAFSAPEMYSFLANQQSGVFQEYVKHVVQAVERFV